MNAIIWSRILLLRKNYKLYGLMFLLPIVFFLVFGLGSQSSGIPLLVVNEDQSTDSQRLLEKLEDSSAINVMYVDRASLNEIIGEGRAEVGIIIEENSFKEESESIKLVRLTDSLAVMTVEGTILTMLSELNYEKLLIDQLLVSIPDSTLDRDMVEQRVSTIVHEKMSQPNPIKTNSFRLNSESTFDMQLQTMLGFILFFSMYTITGSVAEIMNDKKHGIWDRLIVSPVDKWGLYIGNFLFSFMISFFQIIVLIIVSKYVIGLNWGTNFSLVIIIVILYIFAIMSIGIVLVSVCKTIQQYNAIVPIVAVSFAMIGGAYWPIEVVTSKILLFLSNFVPVTYAMSAIKDIVFYGARWQEILYPSFILLLMSVVLTTVAVRLLEKKVV